MLLKDEIIEKIKSGEITLIFRRWKKPGVKSGGTQMTQGGVVGIDTVEVISDADVTDQNALDAGFASRDELLSHLNYREDPIYRIRVHWAGEDPRKALRENAELNDDEIEGIISKLQKLDAGSTRGPWTQEYLQLIQDMPSTYSGLLADYVGLSIPQFKPLVRKLKALGLTESLSPGYKLSPRGEKVLAAIQRRR